MPNKAIQDSYADHDSHCYGCGRLNEHGMQIKSHWNGTESICIYTPEAYRSSLPGYAYGGLIASLIDCHGIGTAMAAKDLPRATQGIPTHSEINKALRVFNILKLLP